MQASVHSFDEQTGAGSVLLDDGRCVGFAGDVFEASGLRRLRPGQRVTIELSEPAPAQAESQTELQLTVRRLGIHGVPER